MSNRDDWAKWAKDNPHRIASAAPKNKPGAGNIPVAKESKWHNKKCIYKDLKFDSFKERDRFKDLELMEKAGLISSLRCQVPFEIVPKVGKNRAVHYIADFVYFNEQGERVVEDSKGARTNVYKHKKKLMRHVHGVEILET